MSRLDDIKPSGYDGRYKVEVQVEGEWVVMALLAKESICRVSDLIEKLCDEEVEGES